MIGNHVFLIKVRKIVQEDFRLIDRFIKLFQLIKKMSEQLIVQARRCHLTMDGWSNRKCSSFFGGQRFIT